MRGVGVLASCHGASSMKRAAAKAMTTAPDDPPGAQVVQHMPTTTLPIRGTGRGPTPAVPCRQSSTARSAFARDHRRR